MRFGMGPVFAKCTACEGEDFFPAVPVTPDRREVFVCVACRSEALYSEIVRRTLSAALGRTWPRAAA